MYLFLFVFWILLNGKVTLEICLIGAAVTAAAGLLMYILFGHTLRRDLRFLAKAPLFFAYCCVLLVEILKACISVMRIILHPEMEISQSIVLFEPGLTTQFGLFVLANSITLTPGTMTVRAGKDRFTVHCLDRSAMDGFTDGILLRLLRKLEG